MRKSARNKGDFSRLHAAEGDPGIDANISVDLVLVAHVLVGGRVEVHGKLPLLERVLAEDLHPAVLDLDDVVAGPRVAAQPRRRGGPRVHYKEVLELPRVGDVLVAREDEVDPHLVEELQDVAGVEDDVALAAGAGYGDEVVVDHEDLQLLPRVGERLVDKAVVLAAYPPVVQVGLRRIYADHHGVVELDARVPLPEEPLEVHVADVARVVVSGDDHDVRAVEAPHVLGGRLELLPVARVGQVPGDHHGRRLEVVYLKDRSLQEVRYKVRASAVDVADLADRQPAARGHVLPVVSQPAKVYSHQLSAVSYGL